MKKIFKNKFFLVILLVLFFVFSGYLGVDLLYRKMEWKIAGQAAGGYPYQIGLTGVVVIPCYTTGTPPVCVGGTLCETLDVARCTMYSDVSGTPAGGMGNMALFLKTALMQAGVMPGGQLIAGGMAPTLMDSGVLAGQGGCYGCVAKETKMEKVKKIFQYFIAGFKK